MADTSASRPTQNLLTDALAHVGNLVRQEMSLARAEMSENASRAALALGLIAGALVMALTALNVLSAALVAAIANLGIATGWAALIVGVVLALIAVAMAAKGRSDLRLASLAPTRTAANVRRDAEAVKESYNHE